MWYRKWTDCIETEDKMRYADQHKTLKYSLNGEEQMWYNAMEELLNMVINIFDILMNAIKFILEWEKNEMALMHRSANEV